MLNSNCHVTLRLTVFEIFAVKLYGRPKLPKMSVFCLHLGLLRDTAPKWQKTYPGHRGHTCTITQNFTPNCATFAEISVTGETNSELSTLPMYGG